MTVARPDVLGVAAASVPRLQFTTPPTGAAHDPWLVVMDPNVNSPSLRCVSRSVTDRASDGPRLSTKIVQIAVAPARTSSSGLHTLVTARSARSWTNVISVSLLLVEAGSAVVDDTVTTLTMFFVPSASAATVSDLTRVLMRMVLLAPGGMSPSAQVNWWSPAS